VSKKSRNQKKKWFGSDEPSKVGIGILFMVEIGKLKLKEMGFNQQTNKGASREQGLSGLNTSKHTQGLSGKTGPIRQNNKQPLGGSFTKKIRSSS
jgi:hypothetical protein